MCHYKFVTMESANKSNEVIKSILSGEFTKNEVVTILEVAADYLDIQTISEMARQENKSPNGVRGSSQYRKVKISKQLFAIKGLKDVKGLPF